MGSAQFNLHRKFNLRQQYSSKRKTRRRNKEGERGAGKENTLKILYLPHFKVYQSLIHLRYEESTNSLRVSYKVYIEFQPNGFNVEKGIIVYRAL